jgi:hypothetical protein
MWGRYLDAGILLHYQQKIVLVATTVCCRINKTLFLGQQKAADFLARLPERSMFPTLSVCFCQSHAMPRHKTGNTTWHDNLRIILR